MRTYFAEQEEKNMISNMEGYKVGAPSTDMPMPLSMPALR